MDDGKNVNSVSIFCSYAHEDKKLATELWKHMGKYRLWHDGMIPPGKNWSQEIEYHLNHANIILFLVSADFFASKFCSEIEVPRAMERYEAGEAQVIPIILRPVYLGQTSYSRLQRLPAGDEPVTKWSDSEEAFMNVAAGIWQAINAQLYMSRGDDLFQHREFENARVAYEDALKFEKNNRFLYEKLGEVRFLLGDSVGALEMYEAAMDLCLSNMEKANILEKEADVFMGRIKERIKENKINLLEKYNKAIEYAIYEDSENGRNRKKELIRSKGSRLSEIAQLEEVIEANKEALEAYNQIIKLDPTNPYVYKERGDVQYILRHLSAAILDYEKAFSLLTDLDSAAAKEIVRKELECLKCEIAIYTLQHKGQDDG